MKKVAAALEPAKMTSMLRAGALAIVPEDIGLNREDCPQVWGVMMELGEPEVVVSLVALVDGSVSIYLSDGAGVIGCGLHPDVGKAASRMLQVAGQVVSFCAPAVHQPMPDEQRVRFYLLTRDGILGGEASRDELDDGALELAELYYAGHTVIGMVELLGAGVDLMDEMQLAQDATQRESTSLGAPELKARGRACRILPYVGTVARRSQN